MKLLLDENISWKLKFLIEDYFDQIIHIKDIARWRLSDREIWNYARDNDFVILTYDADFQYLSTLYGSPPKVIWLRIGNSSKKTIANLIASKIEQLNKLIADNSINLVELY